MRRERFPADENHVAFLRRELAERGCPVEGPVPDAAFPHFLRTIEQLRDELDSAFSAIAEEAADVRRISATDVPRPP